MNYKRHGFPSKVDTDPIFKLVIKEDHSVDYAEELRLFYVALTRTKRRVFIICPENRPSEFVRELINDYSGVVVDGKLSIETENGKLLEKNCPICGYPLQLRKDRNMGFSIWMCTNEPELCSYITNKPEARNLQIVKCDQCTDGYLIVRPPKNGHYFLGCTNYKRDGSGCSNMISEEQFTMWSELDEWNSFENDSAAEEQKDCKGFCIRCGKKIDFNVDLNNPRPYCYSCYKEWANEGCDERQIESFCHYCGNRTTNTSFLKPVEWECYRKLK